MAVGYGRAAPSNKAFAADEACGVLRSYVRWPREAQLRCAPPTARGTLELIGGATASPLKPSRWTDSEARDDDITSPRGELALQLLRQGRSIAIEDLSLRLSGPGELEVVVWSQWGIDEAPDGAEANAAISGARRFAHLLEVWSELRSAIAGLRRTVLLGYDYGNGAVILGRVGNDGTYSPSRSA
jgi:hypothetical protein